MVCIYCGSKTNVTNSRARNKDLLIWRRRTCSACHATFTTEETIVLSAALRVEKRNGTIEPFLRDKLFLSIFRASDHLATPHEIANDITKTILRHCYNQRPLDPIIPTKELSKIASTVLKRFNAAASVKYLSYQTSMQLPRDVQRSLKK